MGRFLDNKLSSLVPYTPGEQPKNVAELIKLNTNECPYPPSPRVIEALNSEEVTMLRLYSDPACTAFIESVARYHALEPAQVFPGNGSDEVLAFCFHGLSPEGALFADITYGFYPVYADMFGVKSTVVRLHDDFTIRVGDYGGMRGTVFIANPNAPTGICLPLTDIEELLSQDTDRLVVVDEAYIDFGGESVDKLLSKYDNLLVIRTLSKSRALAGARIGYALGSPELISDLNMMKFSFNPYNMNRLSILAGAAAMDDVEYFESIRGQIIESREYTKEQLTELGFSVLNSSANFLFAGVNARISGEEYFKALREKGILVRYFSAPRLRDYVRISIGTRQQMEALIKATEEILREAEVDA